MRHETLGCRKIAAGVIIGTDGPHSRVAQWIGSANRGLVPGVQVNMDLVRPMEFTEVFFDRRIYGGYGLAFSRKAPPQISAWE